MIVINSTDELIRHVLLKDPYPTTPLSLGPHDTELHRGEHHFVFNPGVVQRAIIETWLVEVEGRYQFDFERADEWQRGEDERIEAARIKLANRGIRARFDNRYGEWRHHDSMEHNIRGPIFVDDKRDHYLVAPGGAVVPIPNLITI